MVYGRDDGSNESSFTYIRAQIQTKSVCEYSDLQIGYLCLCHPDFLGDSAISTFLYTREDSPRWVQMLAVLLSAANHAGCGFKKGGCRGCICTNTTSLCSLHIHIIYPKPAQTCLYITVLMSHALTWPQIPKAPQRASHTSQ